MRESEGGSSAGGALGVVSADVDCDLVKLWLAESTNGVPPNPVITIPTEASRNRGWVVVDSSGTLLVPAARTSCALLTGGSAGVALLTGAASTDRVVLVEGAMWAASADSADTS